MIIPNDVKAISFLSIKAGLTIYDKKTSRDEDVYNIECNCSVFLLAIRVPSPT